MVRFKSCETSGWIRAAGSAALVFLLVACSGFEESGLPGSASSMARNKIMLVRKDPPSFGYYRLTSQSAVYPDLALFLQKKGTPEFLAEARDENRSYFIFYYLAQRAAYVCRTRAERSQAMEFSGPYPITRKEYQTLDRMRGP